MLLLAGRPQPLGPANVKDWKMCGDPKPHPLDPRLKVLTYPFNSSTYLTIDTNGVLGFSSVAGPDTQVQVRSAPVALGEPLGAVLECERAGSIVFECVVGLV